MTLNQLRYFCMASRCHSITKAAEELYVTQPTVSVAIRDLEIEFGVSLFSRKGNQLILTREGEEFYQKANYILQYCNELQADYSNLSRVRPPIRIGIPPMLSTVFFPELLLAFSEEHPEIAVSLEEYGSVRACNLVQDDTLDLALVNMEQYNIDKFHHAVLADDQVVFCVAKNHPLAGREVVSIQDMAKQPLIFFNADSVQNQLLKLRFELEGYTPNIIMRSSQIYTTLQFLKTGRYACFLYSSMTDKFPEIIGIPMQTPIRVKIGMIWKKSRYISSDMRHIVKIRLHDTRNAVVCDENIRFFIGFFPNFIQQIIDSLRQPQSRFAALVAHCEAFLRLFEIRSIACCGLPFSKILLRQPRLRPRRDAGHLGNMFRGVCRTNQRGIQNLIRLNPLFQDFLPGLNRLLMPKFRQCNIRRPTDLILHIPDRLPVTHKIKMSHEMIPPAYPRQMFLSFQNITSPHLPQ